MTASYFPAIRFKFPFTVQALGRCPLYDKPHGRVVREITDNREMQVWELRGAWARVYPPPNQTGAPLWVAYLP